MTHTINKKAVGALNTNGLHTDTNETDFRSYGADSKALKLTTTKAETRVDSRLLAQHMNNQHKAVFSLIERYSDKFNEFGQLTFKREVGSRKQGGGNAERFALLTEDQAYLLLSLSRNSDRAVALKVKLVKAFSAARKARDLRGTEYLPGYHELHDALHELVSGSEHERQVHMNFNKLVNKAAGIAAGERTGLSLPKQSLLIVAQLMTLQAVRLAPGHKEAYQLSKVAVAPLLALGDALPMLEIGTYGQH